jgi:hypothetical protein
MRGRPPKSIEQRRNEDNFNPTRHCCRVPMLVAGRYKPACRQHLTGEARRAYHTLIDDQWDSGYLDAGDRLLVASAAILHVVAMKAQETADKVWLAYQVTRGGPLRSCGLQGQGTQPRRLGLSLGQHRGRRHTAVGTPVFSAGPAV